MSATRKARGGGNQKEKHNRKNKPTHNKDSSKQIQFLDRTLYVSVNLIGLPVEVQISDGSWIEGILHTVSTNKGYGVVLQCARKKPQNNDVLTTPFEPTIVISPSEFVQMKAIDAIFVEDMLDVVGNVSSGFMTDTAISKAGDLSERELEPWKPDATIPAPSLTGGLSNWDQFTENERLFGVKTTYNEEIYTTQLDKSSEFYKQKELEAAKLANEISREQSSNIHVAVERGHEVDADEEELYGSVIRTEPPKPSGPAKYIPPARRAQLEKAASTKPDSKPQPTQKPQEKTIIAESQTIVETRTEPPSTTEKPISVEEKPKPTESLPELKPKTPEPVISIKSTESETDQTKPINELYCYYLNRISFTTPSKEASPDWSCFGRPSYKHVEEETPYFPYIPPPYFAQHFIPYQFPQKHRGIHFGHPLPLKMTSSPPGYFPIYPPDFPYPSDTHLP